MHTNTHTKTLHLRNIHVHTHTHTHREVAQKCFCESANCRGYLGVTKQMAASGKLLLPSTSREMGSPRSPRGSPRSPSVREGRRKGRTRTQSVADSMVRMGPLTTVLIHVYPPSLPPSLPPPHSLPLSLRKKCTKLLVPAGV